MSVFYLKSNIYFDYLIKILIFVKMKGNYTINGWHPYSKSGQ